MKDTSDPGVPQLIEALAAEIRDGGPISFARFMEVALYEPVCGYYAASARRVGGQEGDFFTATSVGVAFGACLARQILEMDSLLGAPEAFSVVEFGAGQGWLARDVLDVVAASSADLAGRLGTILADVSPAMRAEAARRVPEGRVCAPGEVGGGHTGCVVAVELFDALPVHRLRRSGGRLREVFVDVSPEGVLFECLADPLPEAEDLAVRYGATPREEGNEAEVCTAALEVLDAMERCLLRGFLLVVDYGYPARELYGEAHRRGSLLAYHRHSASEDYLARVGRQDLTAHVNFSALMDRARERGLAVLGLTTQDRFLIANGILDRFPARDTESWYRPAQVRQRLQALQLIHPGGMGGTFKVLVLSKGVDPPPALAGLRDPFARDRAASPPLG